MSVLEPESRMLFAGYWKRGSRKLFNCCGVSLLRDEENCAALLHLVMTGLDKWLLSLNTMLSSFFYCTVFPRTPFLSMAEWFPQHGFLLAIINNVTINIYVKVLHRHVLSFLLDLCTRVGQVYGNIILRHLRSGQAVSHSGCSISHCQQQWTSVLISLQPS